MFATHSRYVPNGITLSTKVLNHCISNRIGIGDASMYRPISDYSLIFTEISVPKGQNPDRYEQYLEPCSRMKTRRQWLSVLLLEGHTMCHRART